MSRSGRGMGFTLVELLGVIAILAILAAIILPAVLTAIEKSEQASCAQNLRQWGLALQQYVSDQGHYPEANAKMRTVDGDKKAYRVRWYHALAPYLAADAEATSGKQNDGNAQAAGWDWGRGDEDQSVFSATFECPEVPDWFVGRNNSYGYNYQYLGNDRARHAKDDSGATVVGAGEARGFTHFPIPREAVARPDRTLAFADSDGTGSGPYVKPSSDDNMTRIGNHGYLLDPTFLPIRDCDQDGRSDDRSGPSDAAGTGTADVVDRNYYNYFAATPGATDSSAQTENAPWDNGAARGIVSNRHQGGANVCFADGHVEWMLREDLYWDSMGMRSNRLWNGLGRDNKDELAWKKDPNDATVEAAEVIDPNEEIFVDSNGTVHDYGIYSFGNLTPEISTDSARVRGTTPKVPPLTADVYHEARGRGVQ